jgi:hypothetical protein
MRKLDFASRSSCHADGDADGGFGSAAVVTADVVWAVAVRVSAQRVQAGA